MHIKKTYCFSILKLILDAFSMPPRQATSCKTIEQKNRYSHATKIHCLLHTAKNIKLLKAYFNLCSNSFQDIPSEPCSMFKTKNKLKYWWFNNNSCDSKLTLGRIADQPLDWIKKSWSTVHCGVHRYELVRFFFGRPFTRSHIILPANNDKQQQQVD